MRRYRRDRSASDLALDTQVLEPVIIRSSHNEICRDQITLLDLLKSSGIFNGIRHGHRCHEAWNGAVRHGELVQGVAFSQYLPLQ